MRDAGLPPFHIEVAFRCNHFPQCYALNRFLALLIGEALPPPRMHSVELLQGWECFGIHPLHHERCVTPPRDPRQPWVEPRASECFGHQRHRVLYGARRCGDKRCLESPPGSYARGWGDYDLVIIRHGLVKPETELDVLGSHPVLRLRRHLLPYYPLPPGNGRRVVPAVFKSVARG
jgi:hypothetical protein